MATISSLVHLSSADLLAETRSLAQAERAATARPRGAVVTMTEAGRSRHVPAAVKRAVWPRDGGRCAFVGTDGRCRERGFLEFHHVRPFAEGGATSVENLALRCRAHNAFEAKLYAGSLTE